MLRSATKAHARDVDTAGNLSDSFDITVCSPAWFAAQVAAREWERFRSGGLRALPHAFAPGHGLWFMRGWDRAVLEEPLMVVCDSFSSAPDWGSVASRIGRLIPWEFDYRYDQHVDQHPGPSLPP